MRLLDRSGQGLMEAILGLPILMILVIAVGTLGYRSLVFHSAQYHIHEALLCAHSLPPSLCSLELKHRLSQILGRNTEIQIQWSRKSLDTQKIYLSINMLPPMQISQTLARNLK